MNDSPEGFDWPALMRLAFQGLGLSPDVFWRMTPAEFLILLGPESGAAPLRRDAFDALLARFPDTPELAASPDARNEDGYDRDG